MIICQLIILVLLSILHLSLVAQNYSHTQTNSTHNSDDLQQLRIRINTVISRAWNVYNNKTCGHSSISPAENQFKCKKSTKKRDLNGQDDKTTINNDTNSQINYPRKVEIGFFPSAVELKCLDMRDDKEYRCGGNIIAPDLIITTASCLLNKRGCQVGVYNKNSVGIYTKNQTIFARAYCRLPKFNWFDDGYEHDVAILQLYKPLRLSDQIEPVCINPRLKLLDDATCYAVGFGGLDQRGQQEFFYSTAYEMKERCPYKMPNYFGTSCWNLTQGITSPGDAGSGLYCSLRCGKAPARQYLVGVLSIGPNVRYPKKPLYQSRSSIDLPHIHYSIFSKLVPDIEDMLTFCREF